MNHFGELSRMTAAAQPNIAVITNIGTSHIEFLGSREGICKASSRFWKASSRASARYTLDRVFFVGETRAFGVSSGHLCIENPACDLTACLHTDGTFDIINNKLPEVALACGECFSAKLAVPGAHNVLNALAAAAVGLLLAKHPSRLRRASRRMRRAACGRTFTSRTAIRFTPTATMPAQMPWKQHWRCWGRWHRMVAVLRCSVRCSSWAICRGGAPQSRPCGGEVCGCLVRLRAGRQGDGRRGKRKWNGAGVCV